MSYAKPNNKVSDRALRAMNLQRGFVPRVKLEGEAPANIVNRMLGNYDGKELLPFTGRPGSMAAFSLKSRGI